jgi:glycosyltransferase 2 family protein
MANQKARSRVSVPDWKCILKAIAQLRRSRAGGKWKGLGFVIGLAIAAAAIFALTHTLEHVDYDEVFDVIRHTSAGLIVLAAILVVASYASLTLYDLLALRTIGRTDISYRIAALASFTSYPIAHGIGAVSLVSPVIRYRIYSYNGLGAFDVANICFLTGLTFWLGNLTALAIGLSFAPVAISVVDFLPPQVNRWLAAALLMLVIMFLAWCWAAPRNIGTRRWPVRLPSGPLVLLQIVIGVLDLGAAALAMYVLIPSGPSIGLFPVMAVFIAATLMGFASHAPAGLGVFDATFLIGLGNGDLGHGDKEPLVAALLMFRLLYHLVPFVLALSLFLAVEAWRNLPNAAEKPETSKPANSA